MVVVLPSGNVKEKILGEWFVIRAIGTGIIVASSVEKINNEI
jgi:hypothetical protein